MKKNIALLLLIILLLALTASACGGGGGCRGGTTGSPAINPCTQATAQAEATATHATYELYIQLTAIAEQGPAGASIP